MISIFFCAACELLDVLNFYWRWLKGKKSGNRDETSANYLFWGWRKERDKRGDLCSNAWLDSLHSRNNLHYAMFKKFQQNKNKNFFLYWLLFRYSCNKFLINFPQLRNHENENSHLSRKQIFAKLAQLRWADKNNFHSGNKISADFHICSMCPCRELINKIECLIVPFFHVSSFWRWEKFSLAFLIAIT